MESLAEFRNAVPFGSYIAALPLVAVNLVIVLLDLLYALISLLTNSVKLLLLLSGSLCLGLLDGFVTLNLCCPALFRPRSLDHIAQRLGSLELEQLLIGSINTLCKGLNCVLKALCSCRIL